MSFFDSVFQSIYLAKFHLPMQPTLYLSLFFALLIMGLLIGWSCSKKVLVPVAIIKHPAFCLSVVFLGGTLLRFYGISFGLPHNYHPDEVPKINAITGMIGRGDFNPNYFLHPSFLLYATYFTDHIVKFFAPDMELRTSLFLAGRIVSAIAGSLSILLLALIGKELYSYSVGVMSAMLLAFFPLHVTCSRYMKEDSLLCFWLLLCVYIMLVSVRTRRPLLLLVAGFVAGLSASTKYSGILTAGVLGVAPFLASRSLRAPDKKFIWAAILGLCIVPIGFVIGTPYSILNSKKFLTDMGYERKHMLRGHTQAITAWSQYWMYHFSRSILPGMATPTGLISIIALGVLAWRRRLEDLFIVGMVVVFYLPAEWVKAKPAPQPERYIFPCLPFLALAIAETVHFIKGSGKEKLGLLLAAIAITFPIVRSLLLAYDIRPDTREQTVAWFLKNVPQGTPLYIDWQPYAPYFAPESFDVNEIGRGAFSKRISLDSLASSRQKYLIISSLFYDRYFGDPRGDKNTRVRIRKLLNRYPVVAEFTAPAGTNGFHNPRLTVIE